MSCLPNQAFGLVPRDQTLSNLTVSNRFSTCTSTSRTIAASRIDADSIDANTLFANVLDASEIFLNGVAVTTGGGGGDSFPNGTFTVFSSTDPTARMQFDTNSISPATTRLVVVPDANGIIPAEPGTGGGNLMVGPRTFATVTGLAMNNVGVGSNVFQSLTDGTDNVAMGVGALTSLTDGQYNVAIGGNSLASASSVIFNVAVGYGALEKTSIRAMLQWEPTL